MDDYLERWTGWLTLALVVEIALIFGAMYSEIARYAAIAFAGGIAVPVGLWYWHLIKDC